MIALYYVGLVPLAIIIGAALGFCMPRYRAPDRSRRS
jgi:hypothetical protein